MDPGDHQHDELEEATQRVVDEIRVQHVRVIPDVGAIEGVGDARLENMVGEKKGNRETEYELSCFRRRHLERTAQPERPQR